MTEVLDLRVLSFIVLIGFVIAVVLAASVGGIVVRLDRKRRGTSPSSSPQPPLSPESTAWFVAVAVLLVLSVLYIGFSASWPTALLVSVLLVLVALSLRKLLLGVGRVLRVVLLAVTTTVAALFCASAVTRWPANIPEFVGPALRVFASRNDQQPPSSNPSDNSEETYAISQTVYIRELASRGGGVRNLLIASGGTLVFEHWKEGDKDNFLDTLDLSDLTLQPGSKIVTNGYSLSFRAKRITSQQGTILSFTDNQSKPPKAVPGADGGKGKDGGTLTLVASRLNGQLVVDLHGQDGGDGGDGLPGAQGVPGSKGSNAVDSLLNCAKGGSYGGRGGPGGRGGDGGNGGSGGDGGTLHLLGEIQGQAHQISFASEGAKPGQGGKGGKGGLGGQGGPGGDGGSGSAFCSGGLHGDPGPSGSNGIDGRDGQPGHPGTLRLE